MTKEEILEKSRRENQNQDEREKDVLIKAGNLSGALSILIAGLLMAFNYMTNGPELVSDALWSVVFASHAARYGYQAYHLKKRSDWIVAILTGVASAVNIVSFLTV